MPAKKTAKKKAPKKSAEKEQERLRLWLMYPPKHITSPIVWELITRFELKANIRQAEVRDEIGSVCLELEGLSRREFDLVCPLTSVICDDLDLSGARLDLEETWASPHDNAVDADLGLDRVSLVIGREDFEPRWLRDHLEL